MKGPSPASPSANPRKHHSTWAAQLRFEAHSATLWSIPVEHSPLKPDSDPLEPAPASSTLVNFVLGHMHVQTHLCSRQIRQTGYTLERRILWDYNFIHVTRGRVVWVIDQHEVPLETGDLVLVPPGVWHHAHSLTKRVTLGSVHVSPTLPGGENTFDLLIPPRSMTVARGGKLDGYLRGAWDEFDRDSRAQADLMLWSWARLITIEFLRETADRGMLYQHPVDPLILALLDELHRRSDQPLNLPRIARWSGYSAQHINRLFRQVLGLTPLQYHTSLRLQRASDLLAEGKLTVQAVARRVGYDDPYYFSRVFKKHYGHAPTEHQSDQAQPAREPDQERFGSKNPS